MLSVVLRNRVLDGLAQINLVVVDVVAASQNKTLQCFTVTSVARNMLTDDAQPGVSSAIGVACSIISGKCVTETLNTARATHILKETDTRKHMEDHMGHRVTTQARVGSIQECTTSKHKMKSMKTRNRKPRLWTSRQSICVLSARCQQ